MVLAREGRIKKRGYLSRASSGVIDCPQRTHTVSEKLQKKIRRIKKRRVSACVNYSRFEPNRVGASIVISLSFSQCAPARPVLVGNNSDNSKTRPDSVESRPHAFPRAGAISVLGHPGFRGCVVEQGGHQWPAARIILIMKALAGGNDPTFAMRVLNERRSVLKRLAF